MTELQLQNRQFLDFAAGGARPDYQYHPAPNAPAKPMSFEEQHMHDIQKAIASETVLLRQWVQKQESKQDAQKRVEEAFANMEEIMSEAQYYGNDVSHLECFPRYCAYKRFLGGRA